MLLVIFVFICIRVINSMLNPQVMKKLVSQSVNMLPFIYNEHVIKNY